MEGWHVLGLAVLAGLIALVIIPAPPPDAAFEIRPSLAEYSAPANLSFANMSSPGRADIIRYEWDFGDGSNMSTARSPTHVYRTHIPQEFTVTLTVWDARGKTGRAQRTVFVNPAPAPSDVSVLSDPPLEIFSDLYPPAYLTLEADAHQEDRPHVQLVPEGYEWQLTPLAAGRTVRKTGREVDLEITRAGSYNLLLTVTNTGGSYNNEWSRTLTVHPPEPAAFERLTLTTSRGEYPLVTTIEFVPTHPRVERLSYEIDWGDGTSFSAGTAIRGRAMRVSHTYERPGTYTLRTTIWSDILGRRETAAVETREVEVRNRVHFLMPAWSPDFRKLAFVYRDDNDPNFYEIRVATLDAQQDEDGLWTLGEHFSHTTLFRLGSADRATNLLPSWSPDGQKVVIMSDVDGQRSTDLYAVGERDSSTRLTRLGETTGLRADQLPTWAAFPSWMPEPYGDHILFCSNRDHTSPGDAYTIPGLAERIPGRETPQVQVRGSYEIYRLNVPTGSISRLTYSAYSHRWPTVSPDGKTLAFEMRGNIYTASLAAPDSEVTPIVTSPWTDTCPRWNPEFGNLIAFMKNVEGRWETWIYDLDARAVTSVSSGEAKDVLYPSWSPDGRYLACQVKEATGWRLKVYEVVGTDGRVRLMRDIDLKTGA